MKYSLKWISELTPLRDWRSPEAIINLLNRKGIEVESFHEEKLDDIVVGKIIQQKPHPQADRLQLCQVQVSDAPPLSIVCGATNQKEGDLVAVCLEGSSLPSGLKIKKTKLRGELSQGMLASESELGLSEESDGIIILPPDASLGQRVDECLNIRDIILDISIPPNRPDLLGHVGLAREIALLNREPLCVQGLLSQTSAALRKWNWPSEKTIRPRHQTFVHQKKHTLSKAHCDNPLKVHIQDEKLCPYYVAQIVQNVQIKKSPPWIKKRLEYLGVQSINSVVDATAWVLLEWGQPLHAFDRDKIVGDIHVRKGQPKDTIVTLKDEKVKFDGDELAIYDDEKPLAIAGVIGGRDCSISNQTKNILIESAVFDPYSVRCTARKLHLQTSAAFYFSRGTFSEHSLFALHRACSLIEQLAHGKTLNPYFEAGSIASHSEKISIDTSYLKERLGYPVSSRAFTRGMKQMNNKVRKWFSQMTVEPPFYRKDLCIKEDLVEEWARIQSYDKVPETLPYISSTPLRESKLIRSLRQVKNLAQRLGCHQAINYNFLSEEFQKNLLDNKEDSLVYIQNPLTMDANVLRQSLLPHLLNNAVLNMRHGESVGRLFEQGTVFFKENDLFKELQYLSFVFWGQHESIWQASKSHSLFFDLKSSVETLLQKIGYPIEWKEDENTLPFIDQKLSIEVEGQVVGFIGSVHSDWKDEYKVKEDVVCAEINLSSLFHLPVQKTKFKTPSLLPVVSRDISLLIPKDQKIGEILQFMSENAPVACKEISVLDYYEGQELEKDHRSIAFRFLFQSAEKTLSEKQINHYQSQVTEPLFKKYPVKYREK